MAFTNFAAGAGLSSTELNNNFQYPMHLVKFSDSPANVSTSSGAIGTFTVFDTTFSGGAAGVTLNCDMALICYYLLINDPGEGNVKIRSSINGSTIQTTNHEEPNFTGTNEGGMTVLHLGLSYAGSHYTRGGSQIPITMSYQTDQNSTPISGIYFFVFGLGSYTY